MFKIDIKKKMLTAGGWKELNARLDIQAKSFVGITGSSGSGKTTFLRIISGLLKPDSGYIMVEGKYWYNSELKINLSPQKRQISFMFQEHALFPNMTRSLWWSTPRPKPTNCATSLKTAAPPPCAPRRFWRAPLYLPLTATKA